MRERAATEDRDAKEASEERAEDEWRDCNGEHFGAERAGELRKSEGETCDQRHHREAADDASIAMRRRMYQGRRSGREHLFEDAERRR